MKQNVGELTEADIKARQRFRNKRGFFGTSTKKELEKRSNKMQKLFATMRNFTREEIEQIKRVSPNTRIFGYLGKERNLIWEASREDIEYALRISPKTFKVNQSNNI